MDSWDKARWEKSEAKVILDTELGTGICPIDAKKLSIQDAWNQLYGFREEFEGMEYQFFRLQLVNLRRKWKATKKAEWAGRWETSTAKKALEEDLDSTIYPVDVKLMQVKDAWEDVYRDREEFAFMEYGFFSQKFQATRKEWKKKKSAEWKEKWDQSEAKRVLQEDLDLGVLGVDETESLPKEDWVNFYEYREIEKSNVKTKSNPKRSRA